MRASFPLALLGAALFAGAGTAQMPMGVLVNAKAVADGGLTIKHDGPAGPEIGLLPVGTAFSTVPTGPVCPHWPAEGVGVQYWCEKDNTGFHFVGKELIRAFAGNIGETGIHDNVIFASAPGCVPGFVDIEFKSLIDAEHYHAWAIVEVDGYGAFRHDFAKEYETFSVPVTFDRLGLSVHVKTHLHVDNRSAPTYQGLIDLDLKVSLRLAGASYVTGGAGCAGTNGVPVIEAAPFRLPWLNSPFTVDVKNLPLDPAKPVFGLLAASKLEPPLDLGVFGMAGCPLYVYTPVVMPLVKFGDTAEWTLPIPGSLALVNAKFYQQVFALDDPSVNALGAVVSNYGEATIGAFPIYYP